MSYENSFYELEDIYDELKSKKLEELSFLEISKYLLVAEELNWMEANVGDDKIFYGYNTKLLNELSYELEEIIDKGINENLLWNYDLHEEPSLENEK